jgi:hypothetical protein
MVLFLRKCNHFDAGAEDVGKTDSVNDKESFLTCASSGSCSLFQGFHFPIDSLEKNDIRSLS